MTSQTCGCGQPTSGAWLCDHCTKTFRWSLPNVAAHHADLGTVEAKQARYGSSTTTRGSVGRTMPLPVDMRFTDKAGVGSQLAYDTRATVVAWARVVMEDQPERPGSCCPGDCLHLDCAAIRRSAHPRDTVGSMVNYLARQFGFILSQRWCIDMMDEFLDLERRLTRMVNRPAERWYAGRCGVTETELDAAVLSHEEPVTCETELYAGAETGTIECKGCGTKHDVAARRDFLLAEAREFHVTASEAAAALMAWTDYDGTTKKLVDLIAYWRDNDALEDHGVTEVNGQWRKVYRLGDVQDRLIQHAQRQQVRRIKAS